MEGLREYNDYYNVYDAIIIILHDMCTACCIRSYIYVRTYVTQHINSTEDL